VLDGDVATCPSVCVRVTADCCAARDGASVVSLVGLKKTSLLHVLQVDKGTIARLSYNLLLGL
jgi:hypothetical protein